MVLKLYRSPIDILNQPSLFQLVVFVLSIAFFEKAKIYFNLRGIISKCPAPQCHSKLNNRKLARDYDDDVWKLNQLYSRGNLPLVVVPTTSKTSQGRIVVRSILLTSNQNKLHANYLKEFCSGPIAEQMCKPNSFAK